MDIGIVHGVIAHDKVNLKFPDPSDTDAVIQTQGIIVNDVFEYWPIVDLIIFVNRFEWKTSIL